MDKFAYSGSTPRQLVQLLRHKAEKGQACCQMHWEYVPLGVGSGKTCELGLAHKAKLIEFGSKKEFSTVFYSFSAFTDLSDNLFNT